MIYHFFNKLPIISLDLILSPLPWLRPERSGFIGDEGMGNGWILTLYHASVARGY